MNEDTKKAALALMNEVRRQNGLSPCGWNDIEDDVRTRYALQAQAAHMSYLGLGEAEPRRVVEPVRRKEGV